MADKSEQVMEMVRDKLQKNPGIATQELYDQAQKIDKSIGDLTLRQFHARFPLQVKRQMAPKRTTARRGKRRGRGRKKAAEVDRAALRDSLLGFAKDLTAAQSKPAEMVDVLANLDKYVDQIVKIVDGGKR